MVDYRNAKVEKIADFIPLQEVDGTPEGDLLCQLGWDLRAEHSAVKQIQVEGKKVNHAHFHHIMPLPKIPTQVLSGFKRILVCN